MLSTPLSLPLTTPLPIPHATAKKKHRKARRLNHAIDGEALAETVVTLDEATTLQGGTVDITVSGDAVSINDATVVMTDVMASNGVIHVIDKVLIPSE
ncbi:MAG: fasciclin domain-containing protein [Planctomycetota bacterium]